MKKRPTLIPTQWTAAQAMLVWEFLLDLEQAVWETHESALFDLLSRTDYPQSLAAAHR